MPKTEKENPQIIEQILALHTAAIQILTKKVMNTIQEMNPEFEIRGYPVWKAVGFRHESAGYICGIFPQKNFVQLVFEWGILLDENENILEGSGKQIRSLILHTAKDIRKKAIQNFIEQSIDLPREKELRRKLAEEKLPKK